MTDHVVPADAADDWKAAPRDVGGNVIRHNPGCTRCGGTGNELMAFYRRCEKCDGTGEPADD